MFSAVFARGGASPSPFLPDAVVARASGRKQAESFGEWLLGHRTAGTKRTKAGIITPQVKDLILLETVIQSQYLRR